MKREIFDAEVSGIDAIPRYCGEVTVGCSDVAGIVEAVARSSERLREEHAELAATIGALEAEVADLTERFETRKRVDRAKGLLMTKMGLSEPESFRWIQKTSMDRRLTMREVADAVIEQVGGGSN